MFFQGYLQGFLEGTRSEVSPGFPSEISLGFSQEYLQILYQYYKTSTRIPLGVTPWIIKGIQSEFSS